MTEYGKNFTFHKIDIATEVARVEQEAKEEDRGIENQMAFKAGAYGANYAFAAKKYNDLIEALTPSMRQELQL